MLLIFQVGTCKFWKWKISHTFSNKEAKFSKIQHFLEVIKKHFSSLYNVFFLYSTRVFFKDIFVTSIFYIFIKILISLTSFFFWQSFFILLIFSFLCIWKNFYKKKYKKMHLLEDLKTLLLNFNFVMICIICKMLVFLKNNLNYLKDSTFECFFKEYNKFSYIHLFHKM